MKILQKLASQQRILFASSAITLLISLACGPSHCAASDNPVLIVRDGKRLECWQRWIDTQMHDCGTRYYDAVFTARILSVKELHRPASRFVAETLHGTEGSDYRMTVAPEEIFKGELPREVPIFVEQGECLADARPGDEWLFFVRRNAKTSELETWFDSSDPTGPVAQKQDDLKRLRRLAQGDGLSYVAGEVVSPSFDRSKGYRLNPHVNHHVLIKSDDGKQTYPLATDSEGKFELGPIAPGTYHIDANTNPQFRDRESVDPEFMGRTITSANDCSFTRIELEINSEISGRVILPEGYKYKPSNIGNFFPLFSVDVDTIDGKQVGGTFIGDGLKFSIWGLPPGSYILQLVNYSGETWIKIPVYAPGVTDESSALRIDLGMAEHKNGLEIRVPPEALKAAH